MRHILAKRNARVLERFARSQVVIVFDYDGTLAPAVYDPSAAVMRGRTKALLRRLAKRYPCAVLSARSRAKLLRFLTGVTLASVVGHLGAKRLDRTVFKKRVRRWRARLEARLGSLQGVELKKERCALAIRYRRSRNRRIALTAIRDAVATLRGATLLGGEHTLTVVPNGAPHKGLAFQRLCRAAGCTAAIYVGDDVGDEEVFALDEPEQLLTVRVCPSPFSRAKYYLDDQEEIDAFFERLLRLR
jgi:trehalose-phosphatase